MKKVIAVLLAVLTLFSIMSIAVCAEEIDTPPAPVTTDENTTRNIVNDEGLVVPVNETQLKFAFVVKIVEKMFKFIFGIFGQEMDETLANGVKDFASWLDKFFADLSDVTA